jgi:hypothetical protein
MGRRARSAGHSGNTSPKAFDDVESAQLVGAKRRGEKPAERHRWSEASFGLFRRSLVQ